MNGRQWFAVLALAGLVLAPSRANARALSVELWTDRGTDAVYQPGDPISIKSRTSDDAFLLVYEIDAEGAVHLLFPSPGHGSGVEGRHTYRLPDDEQNELVVDSETGQGYVIAIASRTPFADLPWYLRPVNPQAEGVGYYGEPDDEEGITGEGKIVGDPFVAMERIRRRVLKDANDNEDFATAYATYYVHDRVRYPRYLCYDCHRPGRYAWWTGFDPYYTTCSVFDFRVNWSWSWGPRYWCGSVPYFVFVYRPDCPPHYRRYSHDGVWYSSWDGWNRWCDLWGHGGLRRYKSAPPPDYTPPDRYRESGAGRTPRGMPPGFIASTVEKRGGIRSFVPIGAGDEYRGEEGGRPRGGSGRDRREDIERRREPRPDERGRDVGAGDVRTPRWGIGRSTPRESTPPPASEPPRFERSRDEGNRAPRNDPPAYTPRPERREPEVQAPPRRNPDPPPAYRAPEPPREERRAPDPPKPEYRAPDPPRERPARGDDGGRQGKGGGDGGRRKDR